MLDPFMLLKLPYLAWKWWVARVGLKTVLVGTGVVTCAVLLYGWYDSLAH